MGESLAPFSGYASTLAIITRGQLHDLVILLVDFCKALFDICPTGLNYFQTGYQRWGNAPDPGRKVSAKSEVGHLPEESTVDIIDE